MSQRLIVGYRNLFFRKLNSVNCYSANRINSIFVITLIAPIAAPADSEPVSPINILAGGALNHKKPSPAPIKSIVTDSFEYVGSCKLPLVDVTEELKLELVEEYTRIKKLNI